jgi:hypothetical protein
VRWFHRAVTALPLKPAAPPRDIGTPPPLPMLLARRPHAVAGTQRSHDAGTAMEPTWPLGTHLITPRRGYVHHGIYAGAGRVIHYAGFGRAWRRGPVEEVSIERFANGRAVQAVRASAATFGGAEAVARARMRLGEDRYRVWTNNCEHFVHWCLSGTSHSTQVERLAHRVRALMVFKPRSAPRVQHIPA